MCIGCVAISITPLGLFVFRLLYLLSSTRYFYFLPEPTSHRTKLLGDKSVCPSRVCPGSPGVFLSVYCEFLMVQEPRVQGTAGPSKNGAAAVRGSSR
jgi:hypothetical protein